MVVKHIKIRMGNIHPGFGINKTRNRRIINRTLTLQFNTRTEGKEFQNASEANSVNMVELSLSSAKELLLKAAKWRCINQ